MRLRLRRGAFALSRRTSPNREAGRRARPQERNDLSGFEIKLAEGSVALVTGASRGIGKSIALALAKAGAAVAVNSTRAETAQPVVDEIVAAGGKAIAVPCDVANFEAVQAAVDKTIAELGRLDFAINNAGLTRDGLLMRMKRDDWDAVIDANLGGAWNVARAAAKQLLKQRGGRVVNVSSIVGLRGNAGQANYAASKAGLIGLTKALAREFSSRNVLVNCVAPGFIVTDMTDALPQEQRDALMKEIPLGRLGAAEDVANAVLFLCSPLSAYMTGQTLVVDGGMVM
jgi:3-oxoacyl-[acyl-carrier protein] reductase